MRVKVCGVKAIAKQISRCLFVCMDDDSIFRALADPTRRTIFERLADGSRNASALRDGMAISQPAMSQHLAVLVAAGLVTLLPLLWFNASARRLKLSTVGILQYVAPTGQFLLAVLLFGEDFTPAHMVTFGCIWAGLALYTADALRGSKGRGQ